MISSIPLNTKRKPARGHLTEATYDAIKRDILACGLLPGEQVSELQLSERYSAGRAAVRTSLNRLRQERLVIARPQEGYLIAPITLKHVGEWFAARQLIEPSLARTAAERIRSEQVESSQIHRMNELADMEMVRGDKHGAEFHLIVAQIAGNDYLAELVGNVFDRTRRVYNLSARIHGATNVTKDHYHGYIAKALAAGNTDQAENLMMAHVNQAERSVREALLKIPSLQAVNLTLS